MSEQPKIENTPGLRWRKVKDGWSASWQARTDIARAGYLPRWMPLWKGTEPDEYQRAAISDRCNAYQADMLVWAKGGLPSVGAYDGTWRSLIDRFLNDPDSIFAKKRYSTRKAYDYSCRRIEATSGDFGPGLTKFGDVRVVDTNARLLLRLYEGWVGNEGHITLGHRLMTMVQILAKFGSTILEDDACTKLLVIKHNMRFAKSKSRDKIITAEQAIAVRAMAHAKGRPSIALAQAFQFDIAIRQKDVIGEWEPLSEKTLSDIQVGQRKWVRGIRWSEIDENLILHHETSKRGKFITRDLKLAPMVMEEFAKQFPDGLPKTGAIIVEDGLPYPNTRFSKLWREIATAAGVPAEVWNMDSRAGAITEAMMAGVEPEHVRQFATHSNLQTTMGYSRDNTGHAGLVMLRRQESRNKPGKG